MFPAGCKQHAKHLGSNSNEATAQQSRNSSDEAMSFLKILTERATPTQITICVMTGGHLKLRIDFPPDMASGEYPSFALKEIRTRGGKKNFIPFFGTIEGFVVNYTPDAATVFTLAGEPVDAFDAAVRSAEVTVRMRGRLVPVGAAL